MQKKIFSRKAKTSEFMQWYFLNAYFPTSEKFDIGYAENIWANGFGGFLTIEDCHTYITEHWDDEITVDIYENAVDDYTTILNFSDRQIRLSTIEIFQ